MDRTIRIHGHPHRRPAERAGRWSKRTSCLSARCGNRAAAPRATCRTRRAHPPKPMAGGSPFCRLVLRRLQAHPQPGRGPQYPSPSLPGSLPCARRFPHRTKNRPFALQGSADSSSSHGANGLRALPPHGERRCARSATTTPSAKPRQAWCHRLPPPRHRQSSPRHSLRPRPCDSASPCRFPHRHPRRRVLSPSAPNPSCSQ